MVSTDAFPTVGGTDPAGRPNIIYIMADDLGYGHLGCYGQEKIRTPNLDRLAGQGMKFTQFYAGFTVCAPSRSVLMTGLHHGRTPVRSNSGSSSLLAGETTVAEVLQAAGYATGGFGKWGLGVEGSPGHPNKKGFDEFCGPYHQVHGHFYYPYWVWHNDEKMLLPGNDDGGREQYVDDVLHGESMAFIRGSVAAGRPFFCYIPTIIPHVELAVPADSLAAYRGEFPAVTINDPRDGYLGSDDAYAVYAGMISRLDRNVGQIMALLDELEVADETVLIFTSDNGGQTGDWEQLREFFDSNKPFRGGKGTLYEGGLRVPFIVRWPGKTPAGSESDYIGCFQDMMPTFAELAGADCPTDIDGVSIVPTLMGQIDRQPCHEYLYWGDPEKTGIRLGDWKAVRVGGGAWEVYDLATDLGETTDLSGSHPEIVAEIETIAAEAYTPPREQVDGRRVDIAAYVRGERIGKANAR